MIVLAHAGHWLPQLLYLMPVVVLVGAILVGRFRERRERQGAEDVPDARRGAPDRHPIRRDRSGIQREELRRGPVMIWFLEDYRDDVVLVVRVQHFELSDPRG